MNRYYVEWKDFNNKLRQGWYQAMSIDDLYQDILNGIENLAEVVTVQQI